MTKKDYIGCCGSCVDCDLMDSYKGTFSFSYEFKCTRYGRWVKADEKGCSKFELAEGRTRELIEKYDR